jgi:hypothetical protein
LKRILNLIRYMCSFRVEYTLWLKTPCAGNFFALDIILLVLKDICVMIVDISLAIGIVGKHCYKGSCKDGLCTYTSVLKRIE